MSVKIGVFRSGPITPRQQDLRAQLELPQLQTFLGVNGGGGEGGGVAGLVERVTRVRLINQM